MKSIQVLLFLLVLLPLHPAASEIIEIPLSELNGYYSIYGDIDRSTSFSVGASAQKINRVWVHVTGTCSLGVYQCHIGPEPYPEHPYLLEIYTKISDSSNDTYYEIYTYSPDESGQFSVDLEYDNSVEGAWDFLLLGNYELRLQIAPQMILGLCISDYPSDATITEVKLFLDVEPIVGLDPTSWGAIKALCK